MMAEYIDRDAALHRAKSFIANHIDGIVAEHAKLPYETCNATEFARGYERGAIDVAKVLLSTPPADVSLVVHGQLGVSYIDEYYGEFANCFGCGTDNILPCNYCRNCGAKMNFDVTNGLDQH